MCSIDMLMATGCALLYNYRLFTAGFCFETSYAFCLFTSLCISIFLAFTLSKILGSPGLVLFHLAGVGLCYFQYVYRRPLSYDVLTAMLVPNSFEILSFMSQLPSSLHSSFWNQHRHSSKDHHLSKKFLRTAGFCRNLYSLQGRRQTVYWQDNRGFSIPCAFFVTGNIAPISLCSLLRIYRIEESKAERLASLPAAADFPSVCSDDKLVVVFVFGESARGDHFSLNGYARETCPNLEKEINIINMCIARSFDIQTRK